MKWSNRKITTMAVYVGVVMCLLAAIWSPEECLKWVLSAAYLVAVAKWFGVSLRTEEVKGMKIRRPDDGFNFINLRQRK